MKSNPSYVTMATEPVCQAEMGSCSCYLPLEHPGAHECNPAICTGSWTTAADGEFEDVVRWPG